MTTKAISQKEYLKKYLSSTNDENKKKKKKFKVKQKTVKIIDDDIDLKNMRPIEENEFDIIIDAEDAPQIAGIVDEHGPVDFSDKRRWKIVTNKEDGEITFKNGNDEKQQNIHIKEKSKTSKKQNFHTDKHSNFKLKDKICESTNINDSDLSPPRKSRREVDSDLSPPRKSKRENDSDLSPPRESRKENDSDLNPPRKIKREDDSDLSPPRRSKREGYSDLSPPRKSKKANDSDSSPPRKSKRDKSNSSSSKSYKYDNLNSSPPRHGSKTKNRSYSSSRHSDLNLSKHRKTDTESSHNSYKKHHRKDRHRHQRNYDRKDSPDKSDNYKYKYNRYYKYDTDLKISRQNEKPYRIEDESIENEFNPEEITRNCDKRMKKTLDGKTAGLQDAKTLRKETEALKKREIETFSKLSKEASGVDQPIVVRDSKTGKRRNLEAEAAEEHEKQLRQAVLDEKYAKWGKGLKQVGDHEEKLKTELYEMSKPLARYADDADLDKELREQEREGDPMLEYIRQKQIKEGKRKPETPRYEGSYMPNRFGIRPGHRWDGVDRSNGYEKKWFEAQNAKVARQEEAYKWSTADM